MAEIEIAELKLGDTIEIHVNEWSVERIRHGRGGHLILTLHDAERGQVMEIEKPLVQKAKIRGEVIHIDGFGNIITNIASRDLRKIGLEEGRSLPLRLGDQNLTLRLCTAYGEVPRKMPLAIIGSSGFLEVAVNQGTASEAFNIEVGDEIFIKVRPS